MGTSAVDLVLERRRTGWDALFGGLTIVAGLIVLTHVGLAGTISILFTGWMLLVAGVVLVGASVLGWTDPARRWNLAAGVLAGVVGAGFVANPAAGLAVWTWVAGSMLLLGGVLRIVVALQPGTPTGPLLYSGTASGVLGLLLLLAWPGSARWFLGTALGVHLLLDGITTVVVGRWRFRQIQSTLEVVADDPQEASADEPEPASPDDQPDQAAADSSARRSSEAT